MNGKTRLTDSKILELLEGQEDILSPLAARENETLGRLSCVNCGSGSLSFSVNAKMPFSGNSPLPNKMARCGKCGTEFSPSSGVIFRPPVSPEPG